MDNINFFSKVNRKLFFLIFNSFNKYKFLSNMFIFVSKFSYHFFFAIYFLGFVYSIVNLKKLGTTLVFKYIFIPCLTLLINKVLRNIFKVKRPSEKLKITALTSHSQNYCFPSNHSASAMIICFCLITLSPNFKIFFIIAIFTGLSRVAVGVHYPFDVLAGFLLAFLMSNFI